MSLTAISSLESRSLESHQLARIEEKRIFYEPEVHHV